MAKDQLPSNTGTGSILPTVAEESVRRYVDAAVAKNSHRAFDSDIRGFLRWGGSLPSRPEQVAYYLAYWSDRGRKPATLSRWKSSISRWHQIQGYPDPCYSELVRTTMRGIKREQGVQQDRAAPLLLDDVQTICDAAGGTLRDQRDRALLLVGFAGALRRSELAGIRGEDLEWRREGVKIVLPRSKSDQEGEGQAVGIPYARRWNWCPIRELERWLKAANIVSGPVFRGIDSAGRLQSDGLHPASVNPIIKRWVAVLGFDPTVYSGHSLRAGLATTAANQGQDDRTIQRQTRHASRQMLDVYIRDAELFSDNVIGGLE